MVFQGDGAQIVLTPEQVQAVEYIINSDAWVGVFRPMLMGMLRSFYRDLADPSIDRKNLKPNNYCRAGIMIVNALLTFPDALVVEAHREQEQVQAQRTEAEDYQQRAEAGHVGPMGIPTDPEEDF